MKKAAGFIGIMIIGIVLIGCQPGATQESKHVESKTAAAPKEVEDNENTNELPPPRKKVSIPANYIKHSPVGVTLGLPKHMKLVDENTEKSYEYGDYIITLKDGSIIGEIHSLKKTRFSTDDIKELYETGQKDSSISISYKMQSDNWFVISGTKKEKQEPSFIGSVLLVGNISVI